MEHTENARPHDQNDSQPYREDTTRIRVAPYAFGRSAGTKCSRDPVPFFLSDPDGEPDPEEYLPAPRRRARVSSLVLMATVAAAALAPLYALFTSDASHDVVVYAKASIATVLPASFAAAQPDPTQLTPRDMQSKDPARRVLTPVFVTTDKTIRSPTLAAMDPTREESSTAYQSAADAGAPAAQSFAAVRPEQALSPTPSSTTSSPPAVAPPAPVVQNLDPSEVASLLNRAQDLISAGDWSSARLLLRRATRTQNARAAWVLAQTYDPLELSHYGTPAPVADVATARDWYEKAREWGAPGVQRRLDAMEAVAR
jgi:hypothetical protein